MARSTMNSAALTMNADETSRPDATRCSARVLRPTRASEIADVAMTTHGRDVTSMFARYSASRAALPAMNCAVTIPAQTIAVETGETALAVDKVIWLYCDPGRRRRRAGAPTRPVASRLRFGGSVPARVEPNAE